MGFQIQLLFACHLLQRDGLLPKRISDTYGEDDFRFELVFYTESTTPSSPWNCQVLVQRKFRGCPSFTSPRRPVLYVGPVSDVRAPGARTLDTLFLRGNSTIPHERRHLKGRKFPHCCADASNESGRKVATSTS